MRYLLVSIFILVTLFSGCGGGGGTTTPSTESNDTGIQNPPSNSNGMFSVAPPQQCMLESRKKFVYDVMHDSYLWADETPVVDYEDNTTYPDETALIEALRKRPYDRFSFIMSAQAYNDFFEAGKNMGYGIYFQIEMTQDHNVTALDLLLVYPGSPADKAGLRRSQKIIGIDNYTIGEVFRDANLTDYFFEADKPVTAHFKVKEQNGTLHTVTVTKAEYSAKSVIKRTVIETTDHKRVGYLLFQSFVGTSEDELNEAFDYFKSQGIEDLVLDLRYNGGGYIYIANQLASLIGGWRSRFKIFNKLVFNEKYSRYDSETRFLNLSKSLSLPKVYILTTANTCSASELVINALRAQSVDVDVVQIGSRTCGKPYGMYPLFYCDRYLLAVQTKNSNADSKGDYYDGLVPQCEAEDDIRHDFASQEETMFASALYYIEKGSCMPSDRSRSSKPLLKRLDSGSYREQYAIY
jgi:C-terminal processing protease CtpA/Prc